jgi:transcription antitermination factor NusB
VIEYHRARRLALQGLCCLDVQGRPAMPGVLDFIHDSRENPETHAEAIAMLRGAFDEREQADELITGQSHHWDVGRMALVDRNILRLSVWELRAGRAGQKIVINEAVRLAKEFSAAESQRFINGVLDAVARKLTGQDNGRPPATGSGQQDADPSVGGEGGRADSRTNGGQ